MPSAKTQTLLVIEDFPKRIESLSDALLHKGFGVDLVQNIEQVRDYIDKNDVDLVLLSPHLEINKDSQILKSLRQAHSPFALPVVMVAHNGFDEAILNGLKHGANDFIEPSPDVDLCVARIQAQLRIKDMGKSLAEREERLRLAMRGANEALWDWNLATNQMEYTHSLSEMLGYGFSDDVDTPEGWYDCIDPTEVEDLKAALKLHIIGQLSQFDFKYRMIHKNGTHRWFHSRAIALRDESGQAIHLVGCHTDITSYVAQNSLTGLPNRMMFWDHLEREINLSIENSDHTFAVLYLDMDDFNVIHDSLNYEKGNELVKLIGMRIRDNLRTSDTLNDYTLSHISDDQFLILLERVKNESAAVSVARRIQDAFRKPIKIKGDDFYLRGSIGVLLVHGQYAKPDDVVRDARVALTQVKKAGKGGIAVYHENMSDIAAKRLQFEVEITQAIEQDEFFAVYQPIVNLSTGVVEEYEALVRWNHPERGIIPPLQFLPQAEELGKIIDIDRWMIREVCQQIKAWQQTVPKAYSVKVAVNLSSQEFDTVDLVSYVRDTLKETGVSPGNLHLELTETILIEHTQDVENVLHELHQLGVQLSLDDFGTGYSSLNYLYRFPTDVLKIDRCFISQLDEDDKSQKIVRATIILAHNLGLPVIAEGIETEQQLKQLKIMGCDYGQGYFFAKPLEPQHAVEYLTKPFFLNSL